METAPALVVARRQGDATVLARASATSPLRLVRPTFPGCTASAVCLVTLGAGLKDGDAIDVELEVDAGATLLVFTQSTTKVFRGSSSQTIRARVRGTLVLLPDPVSAFAGACYRQRIDVELDGDGACVVLDGFTSGRAAFGERWAFDRVDMSTSISRHGKVLVRDALVLDVTDGDIAARGDRFEAFLTLLAVGRGVASVAEAVAAPGPARGEVVVAGGRLPTRAGGAFARIAGTSRELALAEARRRLRDLPDTGAVDPFASRS
jgi:urease accessory protein